MGYFKQFEKFDPISGWVPYHPFSILPEIAQRARNILKGRRHDQICEIACETDWMIENYYLTIKKEEIQKLESVVNGQRRFKRESDQSIKDYETASNFFSWENENENGDGYWLFNNRLESDLAVPTPDTFSELSALKESIGWYVMDGNGEHAFAAMALWLLADAIILLTKNADKTDLPNIYSKAGSCALNAMDAVSFAERLKERGDEEKQHIKFLSIKGVLILSDNGLPQRIEDVIGDSESKRARDSIASRIDQKLKPEFLDFCEKVVNEGHHKKINYLKDLLSIEGCKGSSQKTENKAR